MLDWLKRHKGLCGAALVLSFIFSEPIPLCETVGDAPAFFSIQYFLMLVPWIKPLPSWVLAVPAALCFALSLVPLRGLRFQWIPFGLVLLGLSFYPLLIFGPFGVESGPLWGILFFAFAGLNLWIRSIDYFYAGAIAAMCWDLGAGLRGLQLGLEFLPEPYGNQIPPWFVVTLDSSIAGILALLWYKRVDFGKRLGWKWLEAVD